MRYKMTADREAGDKTTSPSAPPLERNLSHTPSAIIALYSQQDRTSWLMLPLPTITQQRMSLRPWLQDLTACFASSRELMQEDSRATRTEEGPNNAVTAGRRPNPGLSGMVGARHERMNSRQSGPASSYHIGNKFKQS